MTSRYHQPVDPDAPNNAHSFGVQLVGGNKKVLELGAASGHVTRTLVGLNCQVTAIEYEAESASDLEGIAEQVLVRDLNDPSSLDGLSADYDVVLAGDVFEHLVQPEDVLTRVARLLKPGGQVIISLPHVAHADVRMMLLQGRWDYGPWGLMDRTHLRWFTLKTIQSMLAHAGLVMTELRRVRVPAFETELGIDRASIPTAALDVILKDPEAETFQFVFAATQDTGETRLQGLVERTAELENRLDEAQVYNSALLAEVHRIEDARLELQERLEQTQSSLVRTQESVVWKLFQRTRTVAFALLGGEGSSLVRYLQAGLRVIGRYLK
ncbi:MAG: methyltransferase domain-containing protein [Solirubrobacterales bacterium]|nr:methyltransferase domain-containing protein [Solirubrobacterales bacterium]